MYTIGPINYGPTPVIIDTTELQQRFTGGGESWPGFREQTSSKKNGFAGEIPSCSCDKASPPHAVGIVLRRQQ